MYFYSVISDKVFTDLQEVDRNLSKMKKIAIFILKILSRKLSRK